MTHLSPLLLVALLLGLLRHAPAEAEPWLRVTLPNLVLAAGALLLRDRRGGGGGPLLLRGQRRSGTMALIGLSLAGLVLLFARVWPRDWVTLSAGELTRRLLVITLIPVSEELYFRGVLLSALATRVGSAPGTILVSALFALMHWPQGQMVMGVTALLSLLLCLSTLWSGSLLWAVAQHSTWKALAMQLDAPHGGQRWLLAGAGAGFAALLCALGVLRRGPDHATGEQQKR